MCREREVICPRSNMAGSSKTPTSQQEKKSPKKCAKLAVQYIRHIESVVEDLQVENEGLQAESEESEKKIHDLQKQIHDLKMDMQTQTKTPEKQTEYYQTKTENERMRKELDQLQNGAKLPSGCMKDLVDGLKKRGVIQPKLTRVVTAGAPATAVVVFVNESPNNMSPEDSKNDEPIAELEGSNTEQAKSQPSASSEQEETESDAPLGLYDPRANYRNRRKSKKEAHSVGPKGTSKQKSRSDDAGEKQRQMAERSYSDEDVQLEEPSDGQDAQSLLATVEDDSRPRSNSAL